MESKYIAAIEIGSSKIKGIVAKSDTAERFSILAVESVDTGDSVRYGRVQNAREAGLRVNNIIRQLENNPNLANATITNVFVADGGRSVCSSRAEATINLGNDTEITAQILERLRKEAQYNLATDRDILEIAPRRFMVDNAEVKKVIGAFGNVLKGEFTIATASPENRRNLERVKIESHSTEIPCHYIPRAIALADMVLSDSERQLGSLLIDFGSETTTMAVYRDNALQMLVTLPMGSANINRDLCAGLSITEESAENVKLTKGEAVVDRLQLNSVDDETQEIINYVSSRVGEIIANINNQLDVAGFKPQDLSGGIVLTGGGARLRGFIEVLEAQCKMKVRRAEVDESIKLNGIVAADNIDVIALAKYAANNFDVNCVALPIVIEEDKEKKAETSASSTTTASYGRREMSEDDPNLLLDDDKLNQEEFSDELPEPEDPENAQKTRFQLLQRIKKIFTTPVDDLDEKDNGDDMD